MQLRQSRSRSPAEIDRWLTRAPVELHAHAESMGTKPVPADVENVNAAKRMNTAGAIVMLRAVDSQGTSEA